MNVIFTGPSLHPQIAKSIFPEAAVLPPIKRGDLDQFAENKPHSIGIIDGEFYQQLAVSPREILPFLDAAVRVYGASSMGALRAVELHAYGMIGIGRVFRLFRSRVLDADDEVALAYNPETFEAISEPLVNTRFIIRLAVRKGILTREQAQAVLQRLSAIYFTDRTRALTTRLVEEITGRVAASQMREFLVNGAPNVKKQDAELLVKAMCNAI